MGNPSAAEEAAAALDATETRTFASRVIFERYGRAGDQPA
jgi:hypothetical protein